MSRSVKLVVFALPVLLVLSACGSGGPAGYAGVRVAGDVAGQVTANGAALTILAMHGHSYLKLNAAFLKASNLPTSICSRFCGKFLQTTPAQSRSLLKGLNMAAMVTSMARPGSPGKLTYLGTMAPGGQRAWLFQDQRENSTFIAQQGQPYVIRVVAGPPSKDVLNLTEWNSVRAPAPPDPSQVVNLSQLKQALSTT